MIVTNKKNLPQGIVDAVKKDYYSKGDAKFSVTGLLQPPQVRRLMALNFDKLTTDASDEIWKLFGSAVHHILDRGQGKTEKEAEDTIKVAKLQVAFELEMSLRKEGRGTDYITFMDKLYSILIGKEDASTGEETVVREERLFLTVGDIRISGATDWYNKLTKKVEDYKVTTVYKVTKGDRSDWEAQLNVYALLLMNAGYPVEELQINAILKDYSRKDYQQYQNALKNGEGDYYPDCPVASLSIPLWKPLDTLKWVIARIEDQMSVEEISDPAEIAQVRPCSLEDRWQKPATYALMKKGNKRASKIYKTFVEANGASLAKGKDYFVETRAGYAIRCEEYCIVKDFCHQFKSENTTEVTYKEMKTEALKNLEELIPDNEESKEIDLTTMKGAVEKIVEISAVDKDKVVDFDNLIPAIPEEIKPKEEDKKVDFKDMKNLIDEL